MKNKITTERWARKGLDAFEKVVDSELSRVI